MLTTIDDANKARHAPSNTFLTLEEILNRELGKLTNVEHFKELDCFINNDKDCAEFINTLVAENEDDDIIQIPPEGSELFKISQRRAQHTVLTYLLGLAFLPFVEQFLFSSNKKNTHSNSQDFLEDWRITAIFHDIGYFNKHITNSDYNLREGVTYWLLTDDYTDVRNKPLGCLNNFSCKFPSSFAYTYAEIESYDKYSRERRSGQNGGERIDHGILGGTSSFNMLVRRIKNNQKVLTLYDHALIHAKKACMAIAQHNIYKSDSDENDAKLPDALYPKLAFTSFFRISQNTPLLLFLSLVDTIECVKKFSKGESEKQYFKSLTVLRKVNMSISDNSIMLDLSELKAECDKKSVNSGNNNLLKIFNDYYTGITDLPKWTKFNVSADSHRENILIISLPNKE